MDDEQIPNPQAAPAPASLSAPEVEVTPQGTTGQAAVDEVLGTLDALSGLPVADHVAIFDRAHEGLRRALSEAGQGQPADA